MTDHTGPRFQTGIGYASVAAVYLVMIVFSDTRSDGDALNGAPCAHTRHCTGVRLAG